MGGLLAAWNAFRGLTGGVSGALGGVAAGSVAGWLWPGLLALLLAAGGLLWWRSGAEIERLSAALAAAQVESGRLDAELEQAVRLARHNAAEALALARQAERAEAATTALLDQRSQRQAKTQTIIREVYRYAPAPLATAPLAPGCPALSPVLDDALGRLRQLRAGAADPGNPGAARPDSRALAELRPGPGAARW